MPVELESSLALYLFKVLVIKIVLFIFATVTVMDLYFLVTQLQLSSSMCLLPVLKKDLEMNNFFYHPLSVFGSTVIFLSK